MAGVSGQSRTVSVLAEDGQVITTQSSSPSQERRRGVMTQGGLPPGLMEQRIIEFFIKTFCIPLL